MQRLGAAVRLTRLDSSGLGFLSLLIPIYARTHNLGMSIGYGIPLLFIYMCTFVANDLDDVERDKINHPGRPLPLGLFSPAAAVCLYFSCLSLALFLTRQFVDARTAFWYYALAVASTSYNRVVEWVPAFKAPYVAAAISTPLFIIAFSYPNEERLYLVAVAGFLFALGRELCMDILDREGDAVSPLHRLRPMRLAAAAFMGQTVGLLVLLAQARTPLDAAVAFCMMALLLVSAVAWFRDRRFRSAIGMMKLNFAFGLYFLV